MGDTRHQLSLLLEQAAQAHHQEFPGAHPEWPVWYAHWLQGRIDPLVGSRPDVSTIAAWLDEADRRHRLEAPERDWPDFYAEAILRGVEAAEAG